MIPYPPSGKIPLSHPLLKISTGTQLAASLRILCLLLLQPQPLKLLASFPQLALCCITCPEILFQSSTTLRDLVNLDAAAIPVPFM